MADTVAANAAATFPLPLEPEEEAAQAAAPAAAQQQILLKDLAQKLKRECWQARQQAIQVSRSTWACGRRGCGAIA
jgi:hypothetical protein